MALSRDIQVARVLSQIVRLTQKPGVYGKLEVDLQDSIPVYTRFIHGQRVDELPKDQDFLPFIAQLRALIDQENGDATHSTR